MTIDCYGHHNTAPNSFEDLRNLQIANVKISDDDLRESTEINKLVKMLERGNDLTIFSPRADIMAHLIGAAMMPQSLGDVMIADDGVVVVPAHLTQEVALAS